MIKEEGKIIDSSYSSFLPSIFRRYPTEVNARVNYHEAGDQVPRRVC